MSAASASIPSNVAPSVNRVVNNFIKYASLVNQPGLGHATKVSYNTLDFSRLSGDAKSMTYRYQLSDDVPRFSTGFLSALMDELNTDTCFHVGNPGFPGVSLQMQTELVAGVSLVDYQELDMKSIVTKQGKKVSFVKTDIRCPRTDQLVAFSSHVKFNPTGSFFMDMLYTNKFVSDMYQKFYLDPVDIPTFEHKPVFDVIADSLEYEDGAPDKAKFTVTRAHTNPFGTMHGGTGAMVMELAAENLVKAELNCDAVSLDSIQLEFLGAGKGTLDVECTMIGKDDHAVQVEVAIKKGKRIASRGSLRLSVKT